MRPSGNTAVASIVNIAAPLLSRLPQCIKCQSPASPLCAEYWHIGATTIRLAKARPPRAAGRVKEEKSLLIRKYSGCRFNLASKKSRIFGGRTWRSLRQVPESVGDRGGR